jgi:hypothetical protein
MDQQPRSPGVRRLIYTALIDIGAKKIVAEGFADDYLKTHAIPAQHAVQHTVADAVQQYVASQHSVKLCEETGALEDLVKDYKHTFGKEPYLGLPIGVISLLDQVKETQRQSKLLQKAIFSRRPIPEEPTQEMGAGIPPPIFCTGSNHCAIASMLSLISFVCILLGYTGNAPPRSFSIHLGDLFKSALRIQKNRCIVIEGIFTNLNVFLQLLGEQYPPYAPFLDRIFSLFSSKTFSKNTDGTCSLHEGSKEVLSSLKMLEESTKSLGDRLQHELLSCGSEQFHSHLQMKPGVISAFGLPCAGLDIDLSTGVVRGLLPQIPFTAESMASFQLFGKTVGSGLQINIASNLFAAICDTRGRNQNFGAEDAQNVGTSHYYLVICTGGDRYFFVDSSRTNVHEISQEDFLQNVNDNGIVIFMRNRVEQEVPQQVAKIASQSHPSVRKHSADRAAASCPHPPQRSSARGGAAAVSCHQPSGSFGHFECIPDSELDPGMAILQDLFPHLFIQHLNYAAVKSSGKYNPSPYDLANDLSILSSIAFDVNTLRRVDSEFIYANLNVTLTDFTTRHNVVSSFRVGDKMFRVTAVVFKDGHVIACPELKDLQKEDPRREQLRNDFYRAIHSYFLRFPRLVIVKMLIETCT